jgi:TnpA family transposase
MQERNMSYQSLIEAGTLSAEDFSCLEKCRGLLNRLGFAYQLMFVKLSNTLPQQDPFEIVDDIVSYACAQLGIDYQRIDFYGHNRKKVRNHQQEILSHLGLQGFDQTIQPSLEQFVYNQALQIDSESILHIKSRQFLKDQRYLCPSESVFHRLILSQRKQARQGIYGAIHKSLSSDMISSLNGLLVSDSNTSQLEQFKKPPPRPSSDSALILASRLDWIKAMDILEIDLSSIHHNYQRILAKDIKRSSVTRLRNLEPSHRYAALVCFLQHCYYDTLDFLADTSFKLLTWAYTRSSNQADKEILAKSQNIEQSLQNYELLKTIIGDQSIPNEHLRQEIYNQLGTDFLLNSASSPVLQQGKTQYVFDLLTKKYSYFRQFMPTVFRHLTFCQERKDKSDLLEAIEVLKSMNETHQRKLPTNPPKRFIPKKLHKKIMENNKEIDRHAWECALYLALKDEVKNGNFVIQDSKRFARIDDYFMPKEQWELRRSSFFARAQLPDDRKDVRSYLQNRLEQAYNTYFVHEPNNSYARVEDGKWVLSVDSSENEPDKAKVKAFRSWLQPQLRTIKLPDLLVEVNNDIHFTEAFVFAKQNDNQWVETICSIIVTIMAHGCNIGLHTMSQMTEGVTYEVMRRITDWQLTDEALNTALAWIVNALSKLTITTWWGDGKTSSSDGHLKTFHQKVLEQNYHPPFGDFALEFYMFIADNYAPFYGKPIECTDGEAPHVLDGHLYNESDLLLEEHFTDTRASSKILFTAFSFLGKTLNPRIRGVQHHHIYRIDKNKDYKSLTPLLKHQNNTINTNMIEDHWEEMAWFYASLEAGHVTASLAMKRLLSLNEKNAFYKANLLYGHVLKTEHILQHMWDPETRRRKRNGLLKGEQMHQLARDVHYAYAGKVKGRDLRAQRLTCSCLTLIMACIVYWQAKEMMRVTSENSSLPEGLNINLLQHVSPLGWANIVLYGEYTVDRGLIREYHKIILGNIRR